MKKLLLASIVAAAFGLGCAEGSSSAPLHHEPIQNDPVDTGVVAETPKVVDANAIPFAFVIDPGGKPGFILPGAEDGWEKDGAHAKLLAEGAVFVAEREVDLAKLPASAKDQLGAKFDLYDARGLRCEAIVDGLSLVVRADPRWDLRQDWDGLLEDGKKTKTPKDEIAEEVWSMAPPTLVAHYAPVSGTCAGASFARSASLGAASVAASANADVATDARAIAFVRALPAYAEIQKSYEEWDTGSGPRASGAQWTADSLASTYVKAMRLDGESYAWVSMVAEGGCGDFNGSLGVLLREDPSAKGGFEIVEVRNAEMGLGAEPVALLGLGDGGPGLLFPEWVMRGKIGAYTTDSITVYSMDCPC
jgi:hypothetical protein